LMASWKRNKTPGTYNLYCEKCNEALFMVKYANHTQNESFSSNAKYNNNNLFNSSFKSNRNTSKWKEQNY